MFYNWAVFFFLANDDSFYLQNKTVRIIGTHFEVAQHSNNVIPFASYKKRIPLKNDLDIGPLCVYLLELISTCCSCLLNLGQVDGTVKYLNLYGVCGIIYDCKRNVEYDLR